MSPHCHNCGSFSLRTSRFRRGDLVRIFVGKFPVRCRTCRERYFVSLRIYLQVRNAHLTRRSA